MPKYTCWRCGDCYPYTGLKELREWDERYYLKNGFFLCPVCMEDIKQEMKERGMKEREMKDCLAEFWRRPAIRSADDEIGGGK